jgi:iron-sulfur cluster assembly accessory protein
MISVSREALDQFRNMLQAQDDKTLVLKLYAQPGEGQVRYGMSWSEPEESDVVLESDGVCLHVDELSAPFWAGAEIGYIVEDLRQGFSIRNPRLFGGGCGGGCGSGCSCGAGHG